MSKIFSFLRKFPSFIAFFFPEPKKCKVNIHFTSIECFPNIEKNQNELLVDMTFQIGNNFSKTIKAGYSWNCASIPMIGFPIVGTPFEPQFWIPSLLHDKMYEDCDNRADADIYFYWLLLDQGVDKNEAKLMYYAVRLGGAAPYKRYLKMKNAKNKVI